MSVRDLIITMKNEDTSKLAQFLNDYPMYKEQKFNNMSLLDNAIYWGYLRSAQYLHKIGIPKLSNDTLRQSCFSGNLDMVKWVFDTLDKNINISGFGIYTIGSNHTSNEVKRVNIMRFLIDKGVNIDDFAEGAVLLSEAMTKCLIEEYELNLQIKFMPNNITLEELLKKRNVINPFFKYVEKNKNNLIYVLIHNNNLEELQNTNFNDNQLSHPLGDYKYPIMYALALQKYDFAEKITEKMITNLKD